MAPIRGAIIIFGAWLALPVSVGAVVTVHLVPHSHDDVGWLKTVDQYATGQNNSIQNAWTNMILNTVVRCLAENPERTFTYVEQAFFQRWWRQQPENIRNLTRSLVNSGQLEMSNGGWCMHDEAAPFYMDMIDQTTLGHKFLMDEFGVCPKTGWQLDPFGHSATQAALLSAEVGFEGLFFGRIDYQDLETRRAAKTPEFVWRASPSLGPSVQVFSGLTGSYSGNYGPPGGFDWNVGSTDEPVQDDPHLEDYNVPSRVNDFVAAALSQANETRGSHILWTMGSDFHFEAAFTWFENLDKIIKYVNLDGRVHAVYSTPARYVAAKASENISWPLKEHDFFPYADGPHQFWTGYFTSRPALKRYIRETGAYLRTVQQLAVLSGKNSLHDVLAVETLWEAQSVAQHHDSVSGTAKQHVTFDYAKRLARGRAEVLPLVSSSLAQLTSGEEEFVVCDLLNVSVCAATQAVGLANDGARACFALWNSLAQGRREVVELPVGGEKVRVVAQNGTELLFQLAPSLSSITNYGENMAEGAKQSLLFVADLPPLGLRSFCLESVEERAIHAQEVQEQTLENAYVKVEFCENRICKITDKEAGVTVRAEQSWFWYNASVGNHASGQRSGAYLFRPNRSDALPVYNGIPTLQLLRGPVVDEVYQTFGAWVSQRVSLPHEARHVEITYTVGEIPVTDGLGKEIVSRISTDLQNSGECFTDSNGREMLRRQRDFRDSWKFHQTEPVAGNYYPITTSLFIRDQRAQLTVLTDASQAGSGCVHDGELELMVHRRLLADDGRGVSEPLNETKYITPYVGPDPHGQHYGPGLVIRGKHLLSVNVPAQAAKTWRPLVDRLHMPALPFFASAKVGAVVAPLKDTFTAVQPLPPNVQIVSLSWWSENEVLLRLAHQFGIDEDAELSKPVDVDLASLFVGRSIEAADERGLAGTITRAEVLNRRIAWRVDGEEQVPSAAPAAASIVQVVTLGPLQIRTFVLRLTPATPEKAFIVHV